MCGIIGYTGYQNARNIVVDGLKLLEYRGYDSAGIALNDGQLKVFKTAGSVNTLEGSLPDIEAHCGIGHTRWATHGKANAVNAHPHLSFDRQIAIVHNGVIENCSELKRELSEKGVRLSSETDSEAIAHLIALEDTSDMLKAIDRVGKRIVGASSFLAIKAGDDRIYMRKQGASLAVGLSDGESFAASDTIALARYTKKIVILSDGESAVLSSEGAKFYRDGEEILKRPMRIRRTPIRTCSCHMRAEIDEIEDALMRTYRATLALPRHITDEIAAKDRLYLSGCGTAFHAALYGKAVFERLTNIPCEAIEASEIDLANLLDGYAILITQSGETADTLRAAAILKAKGIRTLAITNAPLGSITRLADDHLLLDAGPEIAVAATKTYNCQLLALYMLAMRAAKKEASERDISALAKLCGSLASKNLYEDRFNSGNVFLIGKGLDLVTAKEGALKLKEITYRMTDAYAAGELKHGPIALIDSASAAIVIATDPDCKHKLEATVSELRSRGAYAVALSAVGDIGANRTLDLPYVQDKLLYPLLSVIPLQNLALSSALALGYDPDKPRNLAKSVTVI